MYKPIIKIERETSGRVTLKINKGNYEDHIWFDDEAQFQGFCYAFKMMMAMGAESFGCYIPGPEVNDSQNENSEGDHQPG